MFAPEVIAKVRSVSLRPVCGIREPFSSTFASAK